MLLYIIALVGVAFFSVSGALAAGQKGFDWVGVILIAVATALGGGTVRDVLLDRDMVFWITDPNYLLVTLAAACGTLIYARHFRPPYRTLMIADALGLALFSILGAEIALKLGVAPIIVMAMGTVTGVFGGVIRDILVNDIPFICRPSEPIYTTAAVLGIILYLILTKFGAGRSVSLAVGITGIAALRTAGIIWKIRLPEFRVDGENL